MLKAEDLLTNFLGTVLGIEVLLQLETKPFPVFRQRMAFLGLNSSKAGVCNKVLAIVNLACGGQLAAFRYVCVLLTYSSGDCPLWLLKSYGCLSAEEQIVFGFGLGERSLPLQFLLLLVIRFLSACSTGAPSLDDALLPSLICAHLEGLALASLGAIHLRGWPSLLTPW